ncbi:MAG: molybdopterin-synthase adenylyltransferase MoeB [Chloroflexota bacterium]|nr:molybdopterin-synthase adenylyltransferase MoeB [Chloroflexota bacterium]
MQPLVQKFGELSNSEIARYGRHLIMPEFGIEGQRRMKAASVLIIGTGGLGSPVALYLAAAGVGRIGLVDYDVVDESNLQRQIVHGISTVGMLKVESAAQRLRDLNPDIQLDLYNEPLTSDNAIEMMTPYDIIIDGTDNFPTRYLVNDACVKLGKPNVYGSILRFDGQLSVFYAKEGPCYRCMFPEPPPPGLVPNCAEAGVLGVLPGIIGTMQATEAIKLITGIGEPMVGRMILYDALEMSFTPIKIRKDVHCPVCGIPAEQVVLIDYEAFCGVPAHDHSTPAGQAATISANGKSHNGSHGDVSNASAPIPQITAVDLKQRIDAGDNLYILDVRNPEEWAISALEDTVKIPKPDIVLAVEDVLSKRKTAEQTVLAEIPRDREVIVHCRSGIRSTDVIKLLRQVGYENVLVNLEGGILAWAKYVDTTMPSY